MTPSGTAVEAEFTVPAEALSTRTRTWRPARRGSTPWSPSPPRAAVLRPTPLEIIVVDCSGSMAGEKIRSARRATAAAIAELRDGVAFAVIAGDHRAQQVYPDAGTARADGRTRRRGHPAGRPAARGRRHRDRRLAARGSRSRRPAPRRHAPRDPAHRRAERRGRAGVHPGRAELRRRVHLRLPRRRHRLAGRRAAHRLVRAARHGRHRRPARRPGRRLPGNDRGGDGQERRRRVAALWTPQGAAVRFVKQVAPAVEDLTDARASTRAAQRRATRWVPGARRAATTTCAWRWCPRAVGQKMRAARVDCRPRRRLVGHDVLAKANVIAEWTDDAVASSAINPRVAHYTGQVALAGAIADGLAAREAGDVPRAEERLGEAVRLAGGVGPRRHGAAAGWCRRGARREDRHRPAAAGCGQGGRDGAGRPQHADDRCGPDGLTRARLSAGARFGRPRLVRRVRPRPGRPELGRRRRRLRRTASCAARR